MADVELRELRYFRAVATEGSLSRAAATLGMAQPPLSRAISQLERRLGVRLLDRDNRGVSPTPAGETLLAETARVLDAVSAAVHRTRRAARANPTLVVTAKPGVASTVLPRAVDAYRALPAAGEVEILVSGYGEQADLVRAGEVDLALIGSPLHGAGLDVEPLVGEPRVAALPAGHALADGRALTVADLHREPMPQWTDSTPEEVTYWSGRDTVPSSAPLTGPPIRDSAQLVEVVALGQAVALVPESLARANQRPDIVYRPVRDASPYVVGVAWLAGSRDRRVADFVRAASTLADPLAETA
ncbi:LysR family transcriptional regulator [Actinophytocola xanthii]|uniref:LysR family transcriptional regulator n=1 Tax=Actinophytocola xanthii TaxID=1912961 RepID=A0A1Q8CJW5_9PSEU|nr:LysR family transcriptional regulator [Actinophytocola xanthii]OLF14642.1 LysR family transcriptional regulator [Actinophytocola xanthii]